MTVTDENLNEVWGEIRAALAAGSLHEYPSVPFGDTGGFFALWPNDDWNRFLRFAEDFGSRIVYAEARDFDRDELQEFQEVLTEPEYQASLENAHHQVGAIASIQIGFAVDNVLHLIHLEAAWYRALLDANRQDSEVDRAMVRLERAETNMALKDLSTNSEMWTHQLAQAPVFYGARNETERKVAAAELIADLAPHLLPQPSVPNGGAAYGAALQIVRRATALSQYETLPRIRREIAEQAVAIASDLRAELTFAEVARNKERRRRKIKATLEERFSLSEPALVDLIDDALEASG